MSKLKLVVALIIFGFLGFQFTFIIQGQKPPNDQLKKDITINRSKNQTVMYTPNKFEFQPLPYPSDAAVPFIDNLPGEIHIGKRTIAVRNNIGDYSNYVVYWENMLALEGGLPTVKLSGTDKTIFGSGLAWLSHDVKGNLFICSVPYKDNPLDISEKK
ncbi:MAG: hypothetical protein NTX22_07285 [Ignavibacteriales bacterium]|nr:hypothetical protein [Ignavibacteriales bacterium]